MLANRMKMTYYHISKMNSIQIVSVALAIHTHAFFFEDYK